MQNEQNNTTMNTTELQSIIQDIHESTTAMQLLEIMFEIDTQVKLYDMDKGVANTLVRLVKMKQKEI